jgi:glycosyltransferase involved in cell wall biosynthesis
LLKTNPQISLKVSIALCTFNGEAFLSEQLASLSAQSHLPDEVVVFDDGSTDQTLRIVSDFARGCSFPVRVTQNSERLGPAQNFAAVAAACSGDLISFCDQDDIWEANKIQRTIEAFAGNPELGLVFSDAEICDSACRPLGYRLWQSVGFSSGLQRRFKGGHAFDVLLKQNVVTGATLTIRSKYRGLLLPIPSGWMHDGWAALLVCAVGSGLGIPEALIRYRQHASQSVGAARRSLYQQYLNARAMNRNVFAEQADQYEAALARLQEQTDFEVSGVLIGHLQEKIRHARCRSAIRLGQKSRVLLAIGEWVTGRYGRFSLGWKSFAQDLFL